MSRKLACLFVAMLMMFPACAAQSGDRDKGLEYARAACAECHAVEPGIPSPVPDIPSFQKVADTMGMSGRALVVWLNTSHPNMPDFIIPPGEVDNLAAYIMSLKAAK